MLTAGQVVVGDPKESYVSIKALRCDQCQVGLASGVTRGQFCPYISREYDTSEPIFTAGEPADQVYVVSAGAVVIEASGGTADASLRLPGSLIGLDCLTGRRTREHTARAVVPTQVCSAPRAGFLQWLGSNPERMLVLLDAALGEAAVGALDRGNPADGDAPDTEASNTAPDAAIDIKA